MRNCSVREANNGWVLEIDHYQEYPTPICSKDEDKPRGPYVFSDWSEMIEFIEDYFAEEE